MNFDYSMRVKLALVLIICIAFLCNLRLLQNVFTFDLSFIGKDKISVYGKRFEDLKKHLAPQGVVGYVNDFEGMPNLETAKEFILAQYFLAPVILVNDQKPELVIGNFSNTAKSSVNGKISGDKKLLLIKDYGNGVTLFRREGK